MLNSKTGRLLSLLPVAFFKQRIIEMTFFVTDRCNMHCDHCFNELMNQKHSKKLLSIEEVDAFSKNLGPMLRLLLSGGEPFLRSDLAELCMTFIKNTRLTHLTIPTNASFTEKTIQDVERIAKTYPKTFVEVKVSLDHIGEKRDAFTHTPGGFDKMIETVAQLKKLKKRYRNIGLGTLTNMVPENQDDIEKIYEFARDELQVEHYGVGMARDHNGYSPNLNTNHFFDFYLKIFKEKKPEPGLKMPLYKIARKITHFRTYLDMKYRNNQPEYMPCLSGTIRAVLDPFGNVYPCETKGYPYHSLPNDPWLIGNLRDYDYSFKNLWGSPKAKEIRKRIIDQRCLCNHTCDMNINILFNWRMLLKGLLFPLDKINKNTFQN